MTIDLGHTGVVRALLDLARLPPEAEDEILAALSTKDTPALIECVAGVSAAVREGLIALARLGGGGADDRGRAQGTARCRPIAAALDGLEMLATRCGADEVTIDLADLHGYRYLTGVTFAVHAPELASAVLRGGPLRQYRQGLRPRPAGRRVLDLPARTRQPAAGGRSEARFWRPAGEAAELRERSVHCVPAARSSCSGCRTKSRTRSRAISSSIASCATSIAAGAWSRETARRAEKRSHHGTERGRRRHPVGRRGQGQDRRLADRGRRRRRAVPGRTQRRPHAGHRRQKDDSAADPVGHPATEDRLLHRQRRRAFTQRTAVRGRRAAIGRCRRGFAPSDQRQLSVDPRVSRGPGQGARGEARRLEDRHDRPRHRSRLRGQGRTTCGAGAGPVRRRPLRRSRARSARLPQLRARALLRRRAGRCQRA